MIRIFRLSLTAGLALAVASPLAADTATAAGLDEVQQKGTLRVAVYKDFPPYSYLSGGRMQGIDVDLARELAERLGVGLTTMNLTASDEAMEDDLRNAVWKGHYLGGGTADVMMHVPVDRELAKDNDQVTIFGPYFQERIAIAHDKTRIPEVSSLLVFAREKVAVELETMPDIYLSTAERGRLRHNIVHYKVISGACEALKSGQVAAFMAPQAQLEHCLEGNQGAFGITQVPLRVGLFSWAVGMAVKADNVELRDALYQALEAIRADGTLKDIFARYAISYLAPLVDEPAVAQAISQDQVPD